ncbi:MAG TPA: hypothetical protein VGQ09_06330 [Chitinophagaceae bacterium]|nr:hypothetical protein [Chitinophagaceae bacterium]
MGRLFFIFIPLALCSCKQNVTSEKEYNFQANIRLGYKYYSINVNEEGKAQVIKGKGSFYTEPLKIESSDSSKIFKIDSLRVFFENVDKIKRSPLIDSNRTDAPRVEMYYQHKKIYDAYKWNENFWDLFRPIMEQLPKGYSPFRASDNPF